jgi:cell division protein FtsL
MLKKALFVLAVIFLLIALQNIVNSTYNLWLKKSLIDQVQRELQVKKTENQKLKLSLSEASKPQFIASQARDKLFLLQPGEQDVIIPSDMFPPKQIRHVKATILPSWEQWINLVLR